MMQTIVTWILPKNCMLLTGLRTDCQYPVTYSLKWLSCLTFHSLMAIISIFAHEKSRLANHLLNIYSIVCWIAFYFLYYVKLIEIGLIIVSRLLKMHRANSSSRRGFFNHFISLLTKIDMNTHKDTFSSDTENSEMYKLSTLVNWYKSWIFSRSSSGMKINVKTFDWDPSLFCFRHSTF